MEPGPLLAFVLGAQDVSAGGASSPADVPFLVLAWRGAVAMLIGLLVGAEREHSHSDKEQLFAGVRTFPIIALLGFIGGLLATAAGSAVVFAAITAGFFLLVGASYVLTSLEEDKGATTEIAALAVYFLGAMCWYCAEDQLKFAAAAAVAVTALLSLRKALHGIVDRFEPDDVHAALKLAVVTVIVLPLMPDESYGPYDAFNPRRTWKYVVLVAVISFAGYVAMKTAGPRRGVALVGALGGLTSSTAVALAFSRKSREEPRLSRAFAGAVVLASTIMFPRILIVATAAYPPLFDRLWLPVAVLTAAGATASALLYLRGDRDGAAGEGVSVKNPFELGSALKFAALLTAIGFASRWAFAEFGEAGLNVAAVLTGLADTDGFAVTAAGQAASPLRGDSMTAAAATAILLCMASNTVVKGSMAWALGSRELRRYTAPAFALLAVAGIGAAFLAT